MSTELGLALPLPGVDYGVSEELARGAEAAGYAGVWTSETAQFDGFTPLAALAPVTDQLRLGLALAPAFTRPPALLAMTAASMQRVSGGRFVLGIGSSSPAIVDRWMGLEYERPLTRVRETVTVLRQIFTGDKVTYAGRTLRVEDFRLEAGPTWMPILIGALGPKMYRLAGSLHLVQTPDRRVVWCVLDPLGIIRGLLQDVRKNRSEFIDGFK